MRHYLLFAIIGGFAFGSQAVAGEADMQGRSGVQVPPAAMAAVVPDMTNGGETSQQNVQVPDQTMSRVLPNIQ